MNLTESLSLWEFLPFCFSSSKVRLGEKRKRSVFDRIRCLLVRKSDTGSRRCPVDVFGGRDQNQIGHLHKQKSLTMSLLCDQSHLCLLRQRSRSYLGGETSLRWASKVWVSRNGSIWRSMSKDSQVHQNHVRLRAPDKRLPGHLVRRGTRRSAICRAFLSRWAYCRRFGQVEWEFGESMQFGQAVQNHAQVWRSWSNLSGEGDLQRATVLCDSREQWTWWSVSGNSKGFWPISLTL